MLRGEVGSAMGIRGSKSAQVLARDFVNHHELRIFGPRVDGRTGSAPDADRAKQEKQRQRAENRRARQRRERRCRTRKCLSIKTAS